MVATMMTKIENIWRELESATYGGGSGRISRKVPLVSPCPIYFAIEKPSENYLVLLEIGKKYLSQMESAPQLREISLTVESADDESMAMLCLKTNHTKYNDIFSTLATDLSCYLSRHSTSSQVVSSFFHRLGSWQHFFDKGVGALSTEAQIGLYGELYFLDAILDYSSQAANVVASWTGTDGAAHDFQFPGVAVEVKASAANSPQKMMISNENQLDHSLVGDLFVFFLSVAIQKGSMHTLPSIVTKLRQRLEHTPAVELLDNRLCQAGYLDEHAHSYGLLGFEIKDAFTFRVGDGFPQLTGSDLQDGLGDLKYSVVVDCCKSFEIPFDVMLRSITEAMND